MLNMGLPKDAVKNALSRDGKDPSIMDLNPDQVGAKEALRTFFMLLRSGQSSLINYC